MTWAMGQASTRAATIPEAQRTRLSTDGSYYKQVGLILIPARMGYLLTGVGAVADPTRPAPLIS